MCSAGVVRKFTGFHCLMLYLFIECFGILLLLNYIELTGILVISRIYKEGLLFHFYGAQVKLSICFSGCVGFFWSLRMSERHCNLYWHKLSAEFVPEGFMRLVMKTENIWSVNPYSRRRQYKHDMWRQFCINYETIQRYTLALDRSFFFTTALIRKYFLRVNGLKTTRWSYNTKI